MFHVFIQVAFLLLLFADARAQTTESKIRRVLVIFENEGTLPAVEQITDGLRGVLNEAYAPDLETYPEYLDLVRFPGPDHATNLVEGLARKYKDKKFDIALVAGPNALRFMLEHRAKFAAGVPIVFGAVSRATVDSRRLPPDVRGVISNFDVIGTVRLARRLQPGARKIAVITGSSDFDKSWQSTARKALGDQFEGIAVEYVSNLNIEGFVDFARRQHRDTILLVLTVFRDADGRVFLPRDAARQIAASSGAPLYTVYGSYLNTGFAAGHTVTFEEIGREMARLAVAVLNDAGAAVRTKDIPNKAHVDWAEMQRRGIDTDHVPDEAIVLNYEPTAWERYRVQILSTIAIILLQTTTIAALIFQERRRRRVAAERARERLELAHLARASQLGELSGSFAHELNQPLTSILANAQVGVQMLEAREPDLAELRAILDDIVEDDKRATKIISDLKRLLVKGETTDEIVDLNRAVQTTVELARGELLSRRTNVELLLDPSDLTIRGNFAQLQQIVLNLLLNAADAMANMPDGKRTVAIQTRRVNNGLREVVVSDRGPGISPELRADIFKPFVSTKKDGLGLGLALCQSIAKAHGGRLRIDENSGPGATVVLELPLP